MSWKAVWSFYTGVLIDIISASKQCTQANSINGMALQGFVFKKFSVTTIPECDMSCQREITCQSFNYVIEEKSCELNNRTKEARPENFQPDPARFYYTRFVGRTPLGSIPQLPAKSCQEIKASEGQDAISNKYWLDPSGNGKAVLVNCDMEMEDIDECITGNHDCHVNATCTNTIGSHNCTCKEGFTGDGRLCSAFRNCAEIHKSAGKSTDGTYTIKPDNMTAFEVFCDQTTAGGGWTVFQRRLDGSVDFYRNWSDYKHGFGDVYGEFWLGLDKIHRLTSDNNSMLRVDLEDFKENTTYAEYNIFGVMNEKDKYRLILGFYSGSAGDSLSFHRDRPWSTPDQDNDEWPGGNCAEYWHGAWWYKWCFRSNLNGRYHRGNDSPYAYGVTWRGKEEWLSLKRTEMKMRPADF